MRPRSRSRARTTDGTSTGSCIPEAPAGGPGLMKQGWVLLILLGQLLLVAVFLLLSSSEGAAYIPVLVLCLPFFLVLLVGAFTSESFLATFFVISIVLAGLGFLPGKSGLNTLYVVLLVMVLVTASVLFRLSDVKRFGRSVWPRPMGSLFLVLAVVLICSSLLAWFRGFVNVGMITGVLTFLVSGLVVYFVSDCLRSESRIGSLVYVLVIAATVTSVLWLPGMLNAVGKRMVMSFQSDPVGLNEVGGTMGMLVALTMGLLVSEKSHSRKLVLGLALLILGIGLILTKSRGAWLGVIAGLVYILIRTKRIRILFFLLIAIPLVASFLEPVKATFLARLYQTDAGDPSLLERVFMWTTALQLVPRNLLLGIGLHNFGLARYDHGVLRLSQPPFYYRPKLAHSGHTHNLYMEILTDLGIFGFAVLLLVLILTIAKLNKVAGSTRETELKGPALGLAALLIAYMTHSLFDYLLWMLAPLLVLAAFLGIALAVIRQSEERLPGGLEGGPLSVPRSAPPCVP